MTGHVPVKRVRDNGAIYRATTARKVPDDKVQRQRMLYILHSTSWIPPKPKLITDPVEDPYDAANECVHGHCATDRVITCGCWG